ncbi:hypothetical protein JD969_14885 [Planctomycetota bacterium]|nr:hypothetical protein JD969_14885 [Planctomycetota bacterium]
MSFWVKNKQNRSKNTYIYVGGASFSNPLVISLILLLLSILLFGFFG